MEQSSQTNINFNIQNARIFKPESLSKCLNKLAMNIEYDTLETLHCIKFKRFCKFIKKDEVRSKEFYLLQNIILQKKYGYLISVEYKIDDGSFYDQCGDALFYDGNSITIVESKIIKPSLHDIFKISRREKVTEQAIKCSKRISSWIKHLCNHDRLMLPLNLCKIRAVIITDEEETEINLV